MKVLFCGKGLGLPPKEGIRNFTICLAECLSELGVDVDILTDLTRSSFIVPGINYFNLNKVFNLSTFFKDYDIIHLHGTMLQMSVCKLASAEPSIIANRYFPTRDRYSVFLVNKFVDKVILASRYLLKVYMCDIADTKLKYIPLACSENFRNLNMYRDIDVLFNSGLADGTGIYTLLSAAKRLSNIRFVFALREIDEHTPHKEILINFLSKHNIRNVELLGIQNDIQNLYNRAKIFVQPTEDWNVKMLPPLSIFEASACGCITLLSDVPWHVELADMLRSIYFKTGDVIDLLDKIIYILSDYYRIYNRQNNRKKISMRNIAKQYLYTYEEVLEHA